MSTGYRFVLFLGLGAAAGCATVDDGSGSGDTPEVAEVGQLATATTSLTLDERIAKCTSDPRVVAGATSVDICVGADLFLRETFSGNGRSCATCHRVDHNFTIDAGFIATLPKNDPIFVAEFNPTLKKLEIPAQMRGRGLILENLDGFAPDPAVRFVLRSVPHNLSMGTSVTRAAGDAVTTPADRTGWSGDGAPGAGTLRDFQTGAITQHYTKSLNRVAGTDFRLATDGELDRIDLFMRQLGRTNELNLASVVMTDAGAEAGRTAFLTVGCNACHSNAGANAAFGGGGNRNFNTGVESARVAGLAGFPVDGGFLGAPANADGSFGTGVFNAPPLIEAADTAPFFHTDIAVSGASAHNTPSVYTIEEAIAFYDSPAFNNSPSGKVAPIDMTADQINNIGRFLRAVNASFNAAQAMKRLEAATKLMTKFHNAQLSTQREELRLAEVELLDAFDVLYEIPGLYDESISLFSSAIFDLDLARLTTSETFRSLFIADAKSLVQLAWSKLGTNLSYTIGDGTVMF
jgi:hypothetical protein